GTLILAAPLKLAGTVTIGKYKTLDVSSGNHKITLQGNWIQSSTGLTSASVTDSSDGEFAARNGVVEFGVHPYSGAAKTFKIVGNTTFYDLACFQERSILAFSVDPHVHKVEHRLSVFPSAKPNPVDSTYDHISNQNAMITLTRHDWKIEAGTPALAVTPDVNSNNIIDDYIPPTKKGDPIGQFWNFELKPQGSLGLNYVVIYYSYSERKIPLPPPETTADWRIDAAPYVDISPPASTSSPNYPLAVNKADPLAGSYYNVNWFVGADFFYSFTEDSDGNGKIDRLRLQAAFPVVYKYESGDNDYGHDPAEGFEIEVENEAGGKYEVIDVYRADKGANDPNGMDNVYVLLKEQDYTDSGARLKWTIKNNVYLKDLTTKSILMGQTGDGFNSGVAWDTAPPRINYALTVPGSDSKEIYFQTSEPVDITQINAAGLRLTSLGLKTSTGLTPLNPLEGRANQFLIRLDSPYEVADLAGPKAVPAFTLEGVRDLAEEAADLRMGTLYSYRFPSPQYPEDYTYEKYHFVRNGTPDASVRGIGGHNDMDSRRFGFSSSEYGKGTHRVTDVLISVPPKDKNDTRYFVWPIWARYTDPANPSAAGTEDFWGQQINDTGIIWDFTGTKTLEDRDATIQVRVNDALKDSIPTLWYSAEIPEKYYARPVDSGGYGHGNAGFALPLVPGLLPPPKDTAPDFINLAPDYYKFTDTRHVSGAGSLFVFNLDAAVPGYESGGLLEFLLRLSPTGMFAARLDIPLGAEIPANWYQRVRPFSYGIRNVTLQRGGATILNNVINPNNGERTYIRYHLVKSGRVTIQVFTLDGTLVKTLRRENRSAGEWVDSWNGTNNGGRSVARGMYFIRVVGPDIDEIRKVMVVK
ncbi:MAG: T9SS type A sorting domain-containing protein, partial [Treponema sp.]|nr:T9SS type A sorting domain-containing protein [Treponema sp.]